VRNEEKVALLTTSCISFVPSYLPDPKSEGGASTPANKVLWMIIPTSGTSMSSRTGTERGKDDDLAMVIVSTKKNERGQGKITHTLYLRSESCDGGTQRTLAAAQLERQ